MFVIGLKSKVGDTVEVFGIFNLMTIFFAQYILFFIAGILAYRNDWLARFDGKDLRFWAWLSLGLFLMMPVLFFVGGAAAGQPMSLLAARTGRAQPSCCGSGCSASRSA